MIKKLWNAIVAVSDTFSRDNVALYSAQASYYIIISSVPFIMLICMIAGHFISFSSEDILGFFGTSMPKSVHALLTIVLNEILEKKINPSISFSAIMLLWTASRSAIAISRGFDSVYHAATKRNFIAVNASALFYTMAFLVIIVFSLVIMVFGNFIAQMTSDAFPALTDILDSILSARALVSIVVLTLFFQCAYYFMTSCKLKFKNQLPGALFSASGWIIFSLLFSIYIDNFSNKSYIYGSLTALIIMMLWVYFCVTIMLIGGEINRFLADSEGENK